MGKLLRNAWNNKNRDVINSQDYVYNETPLHKVVRFKMVDNFKVRYIISSIDIILYTDRIHWKVISSGLLVMTNEKMFV